MSLYQLRYSFESGHLVDAIMVKKKNATLKSPTDFELFLNEISLVRGQLHHDILRALMSQTSRIHDI